MAPTAPNVLEQTRLQEEKINTAYAPSTLRSSMSAPTTPIAPQYKGTTPQRSSMRTISASDFVGMGWPPAPSHNTLETDHDPFAVPIPSPVAFRTRLNSQGRLPVTVQDSQVKDIQAYVEDSDSENGSIVGHTASPRSTSHVTIGSPKDECEGERKGKGKGMVEDEGESKSTR